MLPHHFFVVAICEQVLVMRGFSVYLGCHPIGVGWFYETGKERWKLEYLLGLFN